MIQRLLVLAIAWAVTACASTPTTPQLPGAVRPEWGSPRPGETVPDFDLPRTGVPGTLRLSSLRGSWVLLHFTASWCPFCDAEVGNLGKLADRFAPRGVKVLLVDVKEPLDHWTAYAKAHVAPSVNALFDADGAAAKRFAPPGAQPSFTDRADAVLDATLILDPSGTIVVFTIPDSAHFDPTFAAIAGELDRLVDGGAAPRRVEARDSIAPREGNVVTVATAPASGAPGTRGELVVTLAIDAGFHVMSNAPSKPNYIATTIAFEPIDGVTFGAPVFPPPILFALSSDESIRTFAGRVHVRVPFTIAPDAKPGARIARGNVRVQACTTGNCLFPRTLAIDARVEIADVVDTSH